MPLLLSSSLRTQTYCFSPSWWREASTANLSSFVRVSRLSRFRFLRHDKTKEGKQFTWMLSRLLMRVWFGGKGGDTWSSLSQIPFNSLFSPSLCPSPSENLLTDYQLISGSRCLRKVGSKRNTKTLGMWVLKVITRFKGNHVDDC